MTTSLASAHGPESADVRGSDSSACAVLDTNVVLDLLLFKDSRLASLRHALAGRTLAWIASDAMLDELRHVLHRRSLAGWGHDPHQVITEALGLCRMVVPCPETGIKVPRCTDPDDQIFIDLAWRWPTPWLFSRDRALLRLARLARPHGLWIGQPEHWPVHQAAPAQEKRQPELPL